MKFIGATDLEVIAKEKKNDKRKKYVWRNSVGDH
jgi:hypothetical protein